MSPLRIVSVEPLISTPSHCPIPHHKLYIPDRVAGSQANPLWNWAILLLRSCELLLRSEALVGLPQGYISTKTAKDGLYGRLQAS